MKKGERAALFYFWLKMDWGVGAIKTVGIVCCDMILSQRIKISSTYRQPIVGFRIKFCDSSTFTLTTMISANDDHRSGPNTSFRFSWRFRAVHQLSFQFGKSATSSIFSREITDVISRIPGQMWSICPFVRLFISYLRPVQLLKLHTSNTFFCRSVAFICFQNWPVWICNWIWVCWTEFRCICSNYWWPISSLSLSLSFTSPLSLRFFQ